MAREFFKDLPDTSTPITASRINGLLNGDEALGSIVVDDVNCKNMWKPELYVGETEIQQFSCVVSIDDGVYSFKATGTDIFFGNVRTTAGLEYAENRGTLYKVQPSTQYTLTCSNAAFNKNFVTFYGNDKLSISFQQFTNTLTFTTPANCYYINFRIGKGDATNGTTYTTTIQLEKGSTATTYTPYKKIIKEENGYVKEDTTFYANDFKCRNLFNPNAFLKDMGISSEGKIISNSSTNLYYIPIEYGKSYIMSFTDSNSSGNVVYGFATSFPATNVSCTYNVTTCPNLNGMVFTPTSASQKYLCIRLRYDATQLTNMSNIQIEVGSEVTPYTPFVEVAPSVETIDISSYKTSNVSNVTRAYIQRVGHIYKINIAVTNTSTSSGTVLFENLPFIPAFYTELNAVNNNNSTTRATYTTDGKITISTAQATTYYINGIIII